MGNVAAPLSREEQVNALHSFSSRILINLVFPPFRIPWQLKPRQCKPWVCYLESICRPRFHRLVGRICRPRVHPECPRPRGWCHRRGRRIPTGEDTWQDHRLVSIPWQARHRQVSCIYQLLVLGMIYIFGLNSVVRNSTSNHIIVNSRSRSAWIPHRTIPARSAARPATWPTAAPHGRAPSEAHEPQWLPQGRQGRLRQGRLRQRRLRQRAPVQRRWPRERVQERQRRVQRPQQVNQKLKF